MEKIETPLKDKVGTMLEAIMEIAEAEHIVLLLKNKNGRHRFGTNDIESVQLTLSAASHMSGQLAAFINDISADESIESNEPQAHHNN